MPPGVDSVPSENEYQEHFLGVRAVGEWGWRPHHLHVPNVMEIWEPKPPGTLWDHTGPLMGSLYFYIFVTVLNTRIQISRSCSENFDFEIRNIVAQNTDSFLS